MKNLAYRFIVITVKRKCALNYLSSHWPLRSGVTLFPCLVKGEHAEDAGVYFGVFQGKNLRAKKETPTNLPWKPLSRQVKFQVSWSITTPRQLVGVHLHPGAGTLRYWGLDCEGVRSWVFPKSFSLRYPRSAIRISGWVPVIRLSCLSTNIDGMTIIGISRQC